MKRRLWRWCCKSFEANSLQGNIQNTIARSICSAKTFVFLIQSAHAPFLPRVCFEHRHRKNTNETRIRQWRKKEKEKMKWHEFNSVPFVFRCAGFLFCFTFDNVNTFSNNSVTIFPFCFDWNCFAYFPRDRVFVSIYLNIKQLVVLSAHVRAIHWAKECFLLKEPRKIDTDYYFVIITHNADVCWMNRQKKKCQILNSKYYNCYNAQTATKQSQKSSKL